MNTMSNQEILANCDSYVKSRNAATADVKECVSEVFGQVHRAYGHSIRLNEVAPVVEEMLLQMAGRIHERSFEAGGRRDVLPDERRVKSQMMTWAGLPVWVDGVVTTAPENWPLIDANDTTPKPPGQPFPEQATCTQHVQVGIGTGAP